MLHSFEANGTEVAPKLPIFIQDPISNKNLTHIVNPFDFQNLVEYAQTRENITTHISLEYVADCDNTNLELYVLRSLLVGYLIIFLSLTAWSFYKYYAISLENEDSPEHAIFTMQKVFFIILTLLALHTLLTISRLEQCPWTLETERYRYFIKQLTKFLASVVESFAIYIAFMVTVGYSVIKNDLSLFEIKFVFGITTGRFLLSQVTNSITLQEGSTFAIFVVFTVICFNIFVLLSTIGFMTQTYRNINQCISLMQGNPLYDNI